MKSQRLVKLVVACAAGLSLTWPWAAPAQPVAPQAARAPAVVHRDWPIRRPAPLVATRPARGSVRAQPLRFAPLTDFRTVLVPPPRGGIAPDRLAWEDGETLARNEGLVEFTLAGNASGRKFWLQVGDGRAEIDWAEIVFASGDAQVVDFHERTIPQGLYALIDFGEERKVDHVRMIARAMSSKTRLVLRLEK